MKQASEREGKGLLWWKYIKLIHCNHFWENYNFLFPYQLFFHAQVTGDENCKCAGGETFFFFIKWINVILELLFSQKLSKQEILLGKFPLFSLIESKVLKSFMQNFPIEQFFKNSDVKCSIKSHKSSFSLSLARWCVYVY